MTTPQKARMQRRRSPEEKARVLAILTANNGNVTKTARETGVASATIRSWRDRPDDAAPADVRERARKDLVGELEDIRWLYLERARDPKAVRTTSGYYAIKGSADITQMIQLLTGGPTARIEATEWGQLMKQIRDSRQGQSATVGPVTPPLTTSTEAASARN